MKGSQGIRTYEIDKIINYKVLTLVDVHKDAVDRLMQSKNSLRFVSFSEIGSLKHEPISSTYSNQVLRVDADGEAHATAATEWKNIIPKVCVFFIGSFTINNVLLPSQNKIIVFRSFNDSSLHSNHDILLYAFSLFKNFPYMNSQLSKVL